MGEDIGVYGGAFGVTQELIDRFGPDRVRDTPISESAFLGAGVAANTEVKLVIEMATKNNADI